MMELLNSPLAEKVPALILMVIVVFGFLRHMRARDVENREDRQASNNVIMENTLVLGGVSQVLDRMNGHEREKETRDG